MGFPIVNARKVEVPPLEKVLRSTAPPRQTLDPQPTSDAHHTVVFGSRHNGGILDRGFGCRFVRGSRQYGLTASNDPLLSKKERRVATTTTMKK
jgi:hypothetical protein